MQIINPHWEAESSYASFSLINKINKKLCSEERQLYSGWGFSGLLTDGGKDPLSNIPDVYPTMIKLGTVYAA